MAISPITTHISVALSSLLDRKAYLNGQELDFVGLDPDDNYPIFNLPLENYYTEYCITVKIKNENGVWEEPTTQGFNTLNIQHFNDYIETGLKSLGNYFQYIKTLPDNTSFICKVSIQTDTGESQDSGLKVRIFAPNTKPVKTGFVMDANWEDYEDKQTVPFIESLDFDKNYKIESNLYPAVKLENGKICVDNQSTYQKFIIFPVGDNNTSTDYEVTSSINSYGHTVYSIELLKEIPTEDEIINFPVEITLEETVRNYNIPINITGNPIYKIILANTGTPTLPMSTIDIYKNDNEHFQIETNYQQSNETISSQKVTYRVLESYISSGDYDTDIIRKMLSELTDILNTNIATSSTADVCDSNVLSTVITGSLSGNWNPASENSITITGPSYFESYPSTSTKIYYHPLHNNPTVVSLHDNIHCYITGPAGDATSYAYQLFIEESKIPTLNVEDSFLPLMVVGPLNASENNSLTFEIKLRKQ